MQVAQARGGTNRAGVPESAFAMPPGMRMRYDLPHPALAECVTGYAIYICDDPAPMVNRYLPAPGMIVVLIDAGEVSVQFRQRGDVVVPQASVWGPTTHSFRTITQGGISIGIGLTAEGWSRLTRLPARPCRDALMPLAAVIDPAAVRTLIASLEDLDHDAGIAPCLDRLLPSLFHAATPADALLRSLDRKLNDPDFAGIDGLAAELGLTSGGLRRLADTGLGMPIKTALTRVRFIRSYAAWLQRGRPRNYTGIDESYHDQTHFLRDSRNFLGSTPRRLDDLDTIYLRASMRARAAVMGAPAHVLHGAANQPYSMPNRPQPAD